MLTLALYGLLAVLLAGALFLAAAYLLPAGEQIAPPIRDEPIWDLPAEQRLDCEDVAAVRLPVALRGYRFAETDLLLDRLADELRSRDDEIGRLRARDASYGSYDLSGPYDSSDEDAETWLPPQRPADIAADIDDEGDDDDAPEPSRMTTEPDDDRAG